MVTRLVLDPGRCCRGTPVDQHCANRIVAIVQKTGFSLAIPKSVEKKLSGFMRTKNRGFKHFGLRRRRLETQRKETTGYFCHQNRHLQRMKRPLSLVKATGGKLHDESKNPFKDLSTDKINRHYTVIFFSYRPIQAQEGKTIGKYLLLSSSKTPPFRSFTIIITAIVFTFLTGIFLRFFLNGFGTYS